MQGDTEKISTLKKTHKFMFKIHVTGMHEVGYLNFGGVWALF